MPRNLSGQATARAIRSTDGGYTSNRLTASPLSVASGDLLLERVPLLDKHLDDYDDAVEPGTLDRIRELAAPLRGARVLHVNATAYGGGVAELLSTHVPLLRDLGIEAEWQVIHGSDEFFGVTKFLRRHFEFNYLSFMLRTKLGEFLAEIVALIPFVFEFLL